MSPEVVALLQPLIDVQPAYNVMGVAMADDGVYPDEVRALVRAKLKASAKMLRETARYIEARLKEIEDPRTTHPKDPG